MYTLKELLSDALSSLVGPRRARQGGVLDAWPAVVGPARARHARALGIRGKTLVVAVDHPAVYYELGMQRESLIEALNAGAGERIITEIQLTMRPLGGSGEPGEAVPQEGPGSAGPRGAQRG